jgi:hypothetical protein
MAANPNELVQRVLVLAPIGRDASAAARNLAESNLACVICSDLDDERKIAGGRRRALVTEAFLEGSTQALENGLPINLPGQTFPSSSLQVVPLRRLPMPTDSACLRASAMFRCWSGR